MSSRRPILAANWKMNLVRADAEAFCRDLATRGVSPDVDVVLFPSAVLVDTVVRGLEGLPVACGGQDVHVEASGAHTGDVSAAQLRDAGCSWTLVGHSERRRDHAETDEQVARKARIANDHGLAAMICVGETREERQAGQTLPVLERQLLTALGPGLDRFEIAYEPVWAIGTGETATPEMAQDAHAFLRRLLARELGDETASAVRLLYGGSAKPENVEALHAQEDVDGFLVGGASLDSTKFSAMIRACAHAS
ncbi:MAG: triose-phosphate isomerase [Acidobacteriota bacterium]